MSGAIWAFAIPMLIVILVRLGFTCYNHPLRLAMEPQMQKCPDKEVSSSALSDPIPGLHV